MLFCLGISGKVGVEERDLLKKSRIHLLMELRSVESFLSGFTLLFLWRETIDYLYKEMIELRINPLYDPIQIHYGDFLKSMIVKDK